MGPGSICTTRVVAGVGVPQISGCLNAPRRPRSAAFPSSRPAGSSIRRDFVKASPRERIGDSSGNPTRAQRRAGRDDISKGARKGLQGMGSLSAMSGAAATGTSRKA